MKLGFVAAAALVLSAASAVGCSSKDASTSTAAGGSGDGGTNGSNGSSGSNGSTGANGAGGSSGSSGGSGGGNDGPSDAGGGSVADTFGGTFRHGMNDGHVNGNWTDNMGGALGAQAGADSNRMKLPEYFLDQWGVTVRTDAAQSYDTVGMSNLVCFLIGPSADHTTAPDGGDLEQYIPTNLYEPIFLGDGTVNPSNYWAKYVEETVTTYHQWVKIWEVWNEPDWTPNYSTAQGWAINPPTIADLPRFNGAIFDYIRMLRITSVVAKKVDPTAQIALGGIGYPTFLDAILRYTDQPMTGDVSSDYPNKGDAYFDVMNFHYYPLYTPGNSDAASDGMIALKNQFGAELAKFNITGKTYNATETGAPRYALGGAPGGDDYAKNYLLKAMLRGQMEGMIGIDWFLLSDGATPGASQDPYQYMGLYLDIASLSQPSDAMKTDPGVAYTTLGSLLKGATLDTTKTAALALPANARGGAFHTTTGKTLLALWATDTTDENASATYAISASGPVTAYAWDYATTHMTQAISVSGATAMVTLTSTPQFFELP